MPARRHLSAIGTSVQLETTPEVVQVDDAHLRGAYDALIGIAHRRRAHEERIRASGLSLKERYRRSKE